MNFGLDRFKDKVVSVENLTVERFSTELRSNQATTLVNECNC